VWIQQTTRAFFCTNRACRCGSFQNPVPQSWIRNKRAVTLTYSSGRDDNASYVVAACGLRAFLGGPGGFWTIFRSMPSNLSTISRCVARSMRSAATRCRVRAGGQSRVVLQPKELSSVSYLHVQRERAERPFCVSNQREFGRGCSKKRNTLPRSHAICTVTFVFFKKNRRVLTGRSREILEGAYSHQPAVRFLNTRYCVLNSVFFFQVIKTHSQSKILQIRNWIS
jgi:hypothetical protein